MMTNFTNRVKELYQEYMNAVDYRLDYYKEERITMMKFFENIKEWFSDFDTKEIYRKPIRKINEFYHKFKRSSKWFARMWNNPDWDFDYLIIMIVLKLKDMRHQLDVVDADFVDLRHQPKDILDSDSEDTTDVLKGLDQAIEIGERIIKNDYCQYTPRIKKWFDEHNIFDESMPDDLHEEFKKLCNEADKNEENDRNEFFNLIRDNHKYWWS